MKSNTSTTEAELIQWLEPRLANFRVPRYLRSEYALRELGIKA